jgi:hypothetical protein
MNAPHPHPAVELDVYRYYGHAPAHNPPPRGLVIFGVAAAAGLAVWAIARAVSAAGPVSVAPTPGPGPGPGPLPPPVGPTPTPGPTQPKDAGPKPSWADDNPYGFNAQPGDPYVSPTGLWIAPDCSRWKMGSEWLEKIAGPTIQKWIDAGWSTTNPNEDVYSTVGRVWAFGWEVGRSIVEPYLTQSNPQGPLCTQGFKWPWELRGYFQLATGGDWDPQTQEYTPMECPSGYGEKPFGGNLCVQPAIWADFTTSLDEYQKNYPALFTSTIGLYGLIWNVWFNLSAGQPWNAGPVQTALDSLSATA